MIVPPLYRWTLRREGLSRPPPVRPGVYTGCAVNVSFLWIILHVNLACRRAERCKISKIWAFSYRGAKRFRQGGGGKQFKDIICVASYTLFSVFILFEKTFYIHVTKGKKNKVPLLYATVFICCMLYWVTQKLPQICTVLLRICIGRVAWFAVYMGGNFWVTQYNMWLISN